MSKIVDSLLTPAIRHNLPSTTTFQKNSEIILADKSSSMNKCLPDSNKRRIDCVNEAISSYGEHIHTIAFDNSIELWVGPVTLTPDGTTAMDKAIKEAIKYEPNYVLVLSDGAVDWPTDTLEAAYVLAETALIDCLYIGPDDKEAEDFMRKLAEIGHGRYRRYDMTKPQQLQLESVIKGLLPPPNAGQIVL
jgi:hypothetical protein